MKTGATPRTIAAALAVGATALAAFVLATAAVAATRTVSDPGFDTPYLSKHGRLDITRAVAERRGSIVTHAVTMRARIKPARPAERPAILLNTRGTGSGDSEFTVFGSTVFSTPKRGPAKPVGPATLTAKGRTWRYRFDLDELPRRIGAGYGWAAVTQKRDGRFADVAPDRRYVKGP